VVHLMQLLRVLLLSLAHVCMYLALGRVSCLVSGHTFIYVTHSYVCHGIFLYAHFCMCLTFEYVVAHMNASRHTYE